MPEVHMRFRTDGWHWADLKAKNTSLAELKEWGYSEEELKEYESYPPAQPGDVWRVRWHSIEGEGPIAGYAICCLRCKRVHAWTTASNCSGQKRDCSYVDSKTGQTVHYQVCEHMGTGSCWQWTGSAEEGTLTASPSLHCQESLGGCGFHGWLQNGILRE